MPYLGTIVKAGLGLLGVSTVAGAGFGIHSALQDKTIGDAVVRKGKKLIENKNIFEIAFKQRKTDDNFLALIGIQKTSLETTTLEVGGSALKNWCTEKLKLELTEENTKSYLNNAAKYCSMPMMTMGEKLKALGKELAQDWDARLAAIDNGQDQELKNTLVEINKSFSSSNFTREKYKKVWVNALKHWCEEKASISLIHDKEDSIFKNMEKYCFK